MSHDPLPSLDEPALHPRRTRHIRQGIIGLAALATMLALCIGVAVACSRQQSPTATIRHTPTTHTATPTIKHTAGMGDPIRDGSMEFVVNRIDCHATHLGDGILGITATGKFCQVNITVKNISDTPQVFITADQKAYGNDKQTYSANTVAELYANNNSDPLLGTISPGDSTTGNLVYDIPPNSAIIKLKLRGSTSSNGAWVVILG